jgi:hypothetical protein
MSIGMQPIDVQLSRIKIIKGGCERNADLGEKREKRCEDIRTGICAAGFSDKVYTVNTVIVKPENSPIGLNRARNSCRR